ncbi:MAG TPA: type II toxin-antitoxin system RelE/ParE family toxin [Stenotrophomonas sp.]|jgi:proteic killer suppression protein
MAIQSFACKRTQNLFKGIPQQKFARIENVAMRKLAMLNAAAVLLDLRVPPANRLEPLKGDRSGRYSIRVNEQFRVCFVWTEVGPTEVEIVDYH